MDELTELKTKIFLQEKIIEMLLADLYSRSPAQWERFNVALSESIEPSLEQPEINHKEAEQLLDGLLRRAESAGKELLEES